MFNKSTRHSFVVNFMSEEEIKGKIKQGEGKVREGLGRISGDRSEEIKGKVEQVQGRVQEEVGKVKRKA
jgi:uncharacterized protein YjbJ (UPF0337 family)